MILAQGIDAVRHIESVLGEKFSPPYQAFSFIRGTGKRCSFLFNDFNGSNIEMTVVADAGAVCRRIIEFVRYYVFQQLNCNRLTVRCHKSNKKPAAMAQRLGFKFECVSRRYFHNGDAVVFVLFREGVN